MDLAIINGSGRSLVYLHSRICTQCPGGRTLFCKTKTCPVSLAPNSRKPGEAGMCMLTGNTSVPPNAMRSDLLHGARMPTSPFAKEKHRHPRGLSPMGRHAPTRGSFCRAVPRTRGSWLQPLPESRVPVLGVGCSGASLSARGRLGTAQVPPVAISPATWDRRKTQQTLGNWHFMERPQHEGAKRRRVEREGQHGAQTSLELGSHSGHGVPAEDEVAVEPDNDRE